MNRTDKAAEHSLRREIGVLGATMMGLGSILGTGVFVSIGIAAGLAGPAVILAIALAGLVAAANALSSAQLAANHPVSGGTYEYGYRWLHPALGFTAGWMFLCAKGASAATAALGFSGYFLHALGQTDSAWRIPLSLLAVMLLTWLVLQGVRHSNFSNVAVVFITLASLLLFVLGGVPTALVEGPKNLSPFFAPRIGEGDVSKASFLPPFLQACALMFVAYTGYGRIATLAEEVREPRRTIPLAIICSMLVSMLLYISVALVSVASIGAFRFSNAGEDHAVPLAAVADSFSLDFIAPAIAVGAITAMLGVLLNLILGLSRVVLAMGRRRDLPAVFAHVGGANATPWPAVLLVSLLIAGLVLIGDVKTTWSFSAFSVLIYYAITNLAALQLSREERFYPRAIPLLGLASCLFLACWVEPIIWQIGLGLIAIGLVWHWGARRIARRNSK